MNSEVGGVKSEVRISKINPMQNTLQDKLFSLGSSFGLGETSD